MKILFEHNGILPVKRYGGTERVIFWLMKELVLRGHQVFCVCDSRSQIEEYGIKLIPNERDGDWRRMIPKGIDIIHLTSAPCWDLDAPVLTMINGNGKPGEVFPLNTVFVSRKHAQNHGSTEYVNNGLDLSEYVFHPKTSKNWSDFLFLAKAKWKVKNLRDCVAAVRKAKKHLHVGGGRSWTLSRFIHSYGMVDQLDKRELLAKCDALLFPVRWEEPFGLAVIEAMSAGLPAIVSPYGSLPDLVNEKVGVVCRNFAELVDVLQRTENVFNPEEIRAYVQQNFSVQVMADGYLKYYERLMRGEKLNPEAPTWQGLQAPQDLLPF